MNDGFQSTMKTAKTIASLEWRLEWRQGHQIASVGMFALSSVYIAFQAARHGVSADAWSAMLWMVYLFSGFTAVGRLFDRERTNARRYLQWTVDPLGLMLGKLAHAIFTTTGLSAIVLCGFLLFLGWPTGETAKTEIVVLAAWLGGLSMTTTLVFVTAVSSQVKAGGSALAAILGLPLLIPQLILTTRITVGALQGTPWSMVAEIPLFLTTLCAGTSIMACILFPYIWRA